MILIRHAIPKSQKSPGRRIFMRRSQGNQDVRAVIFVNDLPKARQRRPSIPHLGGPDGQSFHSRSLSKVKIGMLQMRNNGSRIFCAPKLQQRRPPGHFGHTPRRRGLNTARGRQECPGTGAPVGRQGTIAAQPGWHRDGGLAVAADVAHSRRLAAERLASAYRLRWQIELSFKRMKSPIAWKTFAQGMPTWSACGSTPPCSPRCWRKTTCRRSIRGAGHSPLLLEPIELADPGSRRHLYRRLAPRH